MKNSNQFTSGDYADVPLPEVQSGCLKVFQSLGAHRDQIVVIGGLVPAFLVESSQKHSGDPLESHVGTRDVDIGFSLGIVEEGSYDQIVERLRESGFERDENKAGNPTNHRWITGEGLSRVQIDFQIPADDESAPPGRMQNLTGDLSAVVTPGLELAFQDARTISLEGETFEGDRLEREINICGPASLIILKGLAINERNKWKDYYDIFYVLRNWPGGIEDLAGKIIELHGDDEQDHIRTCNENLERDFQSMGHIGPRNIIRFIYGEGFEDQLDDEQEQILRQSQILVENLCSRIKSDLS